MWNFTGLADGNHWVTVYATDSANNTNSSTVGFRVDTSIFSPTGPFGLWVISLLIVAIIAIVCIALAVIWRKRKPGKPE